MNNLTTRKIVLGMLMALVLAFSVQGIADGADLPLTKVSGDFQEKTSGNKFDITFTISQRNKTDIKNENGKLVTDGRAITIPSVGVESVRINRSGYLVMDVGTTEYRTSTSIPNTGYYRETSTSPWKQAKSSGGTLVIGNTNTNVYFVPTGTAKAYRFTMKNLMPREHL